MESKYFPVMSRGSQTTFSKLETGHHVKAIYDYEDQTFVDLTIHNDLFFAKVILYCPLFRNLKCIILDVCTLMPPNIYRNVKMEELFLSHQQFTIDQWRTLFHSTFLLDYFWTLEKMPKVLTIQQSNFVTYISNAISNVRLDKFVITQLSTLKSIWRCMYHSIFVTISNTQSDVEITCCLFVAYVLGYMFRQKS